MVMDLVSTASGVPPTMAVVAVAPLESTNPMGRFVICAAVRTLLATNGVAFIVMASPTKRKDVLVQNTEDIGIESEHTSETSRGETECEGRQGWGDIH